MVSGRVASALLATAVAASTASVATGQVCEAAVPYNFSCVGPNSAKSFLAQVTDPAIYSRTERPRCGTDEEAEPTKVEVQLYITQVNSIDQKASSIVLNGYMRTWWKDPRLAFRKVSEGGCFDSISLMEDPSHLIWTPDLYMENLISSGTGLFAQLLSVSSDGSIWRSEQVLLKLKMPMDLGKLPFDDHTASLVLASFSQDRTKMRIVPRGGTAGEESTGVGVQAGGLNSVVWAFPNDELEDPSLGFEVPGKVWEQDGRDFVALEFKITRKPKFFIDQVCIPSILFLLVSYIQFFVPPTIAPARAALAVIPVLIMRTMSNSVYRTLPEGSQQMWLGDFLQTAMFLCCFAALQFGLVQLFLSKENHRIAKNAGVLAAKDLLAALLEKCKDGSTLTSLLQRCEKQQCSAPKDAAASDDVPVAIDNGAGGGKFFKASDESIKLKCKEADLAFLVYALNIYKSFDKDNSMELSINEIRKALVFFNIYMPNQKLAPIVCMFLRDLGKPSPFNEQEVVLRFREFLMFMMDFSKFALVETKKIRNPLVRLQAGFQAMGPTEATDVISRISFPIILVLFVIIFELMKPLY